MNKEKVSILSIIVNVFLGGSKFLAGWFLNSAALMADGVHSGLDIVSSFAAFLGIKTAKKPVDEKHPYGYYLAETMAGLAISLFLALSGGWILYEGITRLISRETPEFSPIGIIVIVISIIVTEAMARLKFKVGKKEESLALVADGEHSRADALSSVGVLAALVAVNYFWQADGIITILIGVYILKESFGVGKEATDNLLGVKDPQTEERIKGICKKEGIEVSSLRTRKIGGGTMAELTIKLDSSLKVQEAESVSKSLQENLAGSIERLKFVIVQVESHELKSSFVRSRWGGFGRRFRGGGRMGALLPQLPKKGYRVIIPLEKGEIPDDFGAPEYLVLDKDKGGNILQRRTVKNPDYTSEKGRGMRFVRSVEADEIITKKMGPGAKERAQETGIKVTIIPKDKKLKDII